MARRKHSYREIPSANNNLSFDESLRRNGDAYYMFFNRMVEIYMNRYIWQNMPGSIDIPTLEYGLLMNGNVCFFHDMVMGFLCLMGTPSKHVDVYNYQTGYYVHTASGYNNHLSVSMFSEHRTGVVIYANYMRQADVITIMSYAERLADALRACDVNVATQKTSKIIGTTDSQRLTIINLMKEYTGNVPMMLVDKDLRIGGDDHPVYDMTTPFVADKLWTYIQNLWNDFLTWCGIENANNQKRERLVEDEINSNYGNVEMSRNVGMATRKRACEEINHLFGLDIDVRFNSDLPTKLNLINLGGSENVNLYSQDRGMGELSVTGDGNFPGNDIFAKN